ncbi:hypothetical protein JCM8202_000215 [Rhodotorula sphaerocarpa]
MATLDLKHPILRLSFLPDPLAVVQLPASEPLPASLLSELGRPLADNADLLSVTRTKTETSIILPWKGSERLLPDNGQQKSGNVSSKISGPWVVIKIAGPMEFELSGILNELSTPLRHAKVPIFAVSTYDTDYVLINEKDQARARNALEDAGWQF